MEILERKIMKIILTGKAADVVAHLAALAMDNPKMTAYQYLQNLARERRAREILAKFTDKNYAEGGNVV